MNYFMKCQLLSEGFKHEQLIEEDWEELKKQLADLYAKNEITQRQVQTRLARAGCTYAAHHAQKIADERGAERQAILDKIEREKQEKAMRAAAEAQAAKHQTRGSAAAEYNSEASRAAWLKAANEYRARKEKERQNLSHSFTKAWNNHEVGNIVKAKVVKEDVFENMFNKLCEMEEELNIELTEEQATSLIEEALGEILEESVKIKKEIDKTIEVYKDFKYSVEHADVKTNQEREILQEKLKKITAYDKTIEDLKKLSDGKDISPYRAKRIKKNLKKFRKDLKILKQDPAYVKILKSAGVGILWSSLFGCITGLASGILMGIGDSTMNGGLSAAGSAVYYGGTIASKAGGVVKGLNHYSKNNKREKDLLKSKPATAKELTEEVSFFNY